MRSMVEHLIAADRAPVRVASTKRNARKATEELIAPTNQRLKGFRMQKKIRGPIPSQLHQRRPKTNDNECLLLAASRHRGQSRNPTPVLLSKQRTGARLCLFRR